MFLGEIKFVLTAVQLGVIVFSRLKYMSCTCDKLT